LEQALKSHNRQKSHFKLNRKQANVGGAETGALADQAARRGAISAGAHSRNKPDGMAASGVRRDKAALSSGCKPHPATAPAGSNRSSHGGNEVAEAFD
jgi:hypothetical protein